MTVEKEKKYKYPLRTGEAEGEYPEISEYLVSIFESSPFALISLDRRLRIMMFNLAAQKLTGYRCEDVVGRRVNAIVRFERLRAIIDSVREKDKPPNEEFVANLARKGGVEIPARINITPLHDENGVLIGVLVIASDLREVERLQSRLLEAERLAAITEIAISINHEINNPLCSILGNTQLILMEKNKLDPKIIRKLRSIESEIVRIRKIADRLAHITRPVLKEYIGGKRMLDVERSIVDGDSGEAESQENIDKSI